MKAIKLFVCTLLATFLLMANGNAQVKDYKEQWKKVEDLVNKQGLSKTALAEVKKIYAAAKAAGQDAQMIKALYYQLSLQSEIREDNLTASIKEIEQEITQVNEPVKPVLKSMLAGMYWNYAKQNRWQLYNRTRTTGFIKTDISTWTTDDFHQRVSRLYLESLEPKASLQKTGLEPFHAIIEKGNTRELRPTLYDLLAHAALDYFKNDDRDVTKPAYKFEITGSAPFSPAASFIRHRFDTNDSLSLKHKALLIYQDLLAFHINDARKDAVIDVDIERIGYVYRNSVAPNKDSLYVAALENLNSQFKTNPAVKQALYLLAAYYNDEGNNYQPFRDSSRRYQKLRARDILRSVVTDSAVKNEGWTNSFNLYQEITRPAFEFQLEAVNIPGQPFRTFVKYRNLNRLYLRLIKINREDYDNNWLDQPVWYAVFSEKALKTWSQELPATNDLQEHSVEIKVDQLPLGKYILLMSSQEKYDMKTSHAAARYFYVSNISAVNRDSSFYVLHRETGEPLRNARIEISERQYDYAKQQSNKTVIGNFATNNKGFAVIRPKVKGNYSNYYTKFVYGDDILDLNDESYYYYRPNQTEERKPAATTRIFFFTDRSIYRPGQTVFFKGLVVNGQGNDQRISDDLTTTIYLRNTNGEVVDSVKVSSNEFGSFNGRFTAPATGLTGYFTVVDKAGLGVAGISVEEYKRPKFEVKFEPLKNSYKVNETVTVTGQATAYAGNSIDGATVSYRVVRRPRFIYTWYFTRSWLPPSEPLEIAHGNVKTDKEGKFNINFATLPDLKLNPKLDPLFDYLVTADVTDINGETRSGKQNVTAGYKSLILSLQIPEAIAIDSFKKIIVETKNLNGVFQKLPVTISLTKLVPEKRLIRARYWEQPDQHVMSKGEYISYFPHDEYANESEPSTWAKQDSAVILQSLSDSTGYLPVNASSLTQGHYELVVSARDKDGNIVKQVKYIRLFDPAQTARPMYPVYLETTPAGHAIEPGQSVEIRLSSSASNIFLVKEVKKQDQDIKTEYTDLDKPRQFVFNATDADRGGYGVNFMFVKDNRVYQFGDHINVPWTNKDLNIEYTTFRDKALPGSEEQWKIKITGYKKEMVASEVLASMYDASLDQFKVHNWYKPDIWNNNHPALAWNGARHFSGLLSEQRFIEFGERAFRKQYDEFLFHTGTYADGGFGGYLQGRVSGIDATAAPQSRMVKAMPGIQMNEVAVVGYGADKKQSRDGDGVIDDTETPLSGSDESIQVRRNFNETAFFLPELRTDKAGSIEFSFTTPEALTRWKLQTFAHTKNLAFGLAQRELVTQKELMVQPNLPRFLRQGDQLEIAAKIVNLSDSEMTGQVQLLLFDAATNQSVDGWFINSFPNQYFTVAAGQSDVMRFPVQVPYQFNSALTWRIIARAKNFTDGEENTLPVLTNKVLVTETLPLQVKTNTSKQFSFPNFAKTSQSETLQNHGVTIEYSSNPAWYVVQALPYLMEYPYECAEQTWNRYYANAVAGKLANSIPRVREVFEKWKSTDTTALMSNLQKNQELKSALLEETPWVLQARSESEQKKNIALLFDLVKLAREEDAAFNKLKEMQNNAGGFPWFKGGGDDRFITQYILTGIGRLKRIGISTDKLSAVISKGLQYADVRIKYDYDQLLKNKVNLGQQNISSIQIQYLYLRSFFKEIDISSSASKAVDYYRGQAKKFWLKQNKQQQAMLALVFSRMGDQATAAAILKSVYENSVYKEDLGRYWLDNSFGRSWYWYHSPIETQSLIIESFAEVLKDPVKVDEMKTWLLKNKQTNNWSTTKATADACYAMLLQGTDWLSATPTVEIQLGSVVVRSDEEKSEAGTGYFKQTISASQPPPDLGNIKVRVQSKEQKQTSTWGAVYWQYFEDMDKVGAAATPLQLTKKLFIQTNTDHGPLLKPVSESNPVKIGDKVVVRIELRVDRDMEYVHMKDLRAAGLEPVDVISGYRWQGGLGYYQSTRDVNTSFFFNYLIKGSYVFEYQLFANQAGTFTNGITTIQCMYAPEFSAHSEGTVLRIE